MITTKTLSWLNRNLEACLGGCLLAVVVFLVSLQVFMRYVMGSALSWSEELTLWSFIWFIWIGIAYAFKERKHVKVTVFQDMLPAKAKFWFEKLLDLVMIVFLVALAYQSYKLINLPYVASQKSVVLGLPIPWLYASAPVGALLSVFRLTQNLFSCAGAQCASADVEMETQAS